LAVDALAATGRPMFIWEQFIYGSLQKKPFN